MGPAKTALTDYIIRLITLSVIPLSGPTVNCIQFALALSSFNNFFLKTPVLLSKDSRLKQRIKMILYFSREWKILHVRCFRSQLEKRNQGQLITQLFHKIFQKKQLESNFFTIFSNSGLKKTWLHDFLVIVNESGILRIRNFEKFILENFNLLLYNKWVCPRNKKWASTTGNFLSGKREGGGERERSRLG